MHRPANQSANIVMKIGGSLFDSPQLRSSLQQLIALQAGATLLVPGGGAFADEIRRLEPVHQLTMPQSHRLAIRAMSLAARLLSELLEVKVVTTWQEIRDLLASEETAVVDLAALDGLDRLPIGWHVTSDSLAAWLATAAEVSHLLLAKSVDLPGVSTTIADLVSREMVDRHFPVAAAGLSRLSWINLRHEELTIHTLIPDTSVTEREFASQRPFPASVSAKARS